jgi:hypothetical protein
MPSEKAFLIKAFMIVEKIRDTGLMKRDFLYTDQAAAELIDNAIAEATNNLLRVLADIRVKTGVGEGPMLSELADAIVAKRDEAVVATLREAVKRMEGV